MMIKKYMLSFIIFLINSFYLDASQHIVIPFNHTDKKMFENLVSMVVSDEQLCDNIGLFPDRECVEDYFNRQKKSSNKFLSVSVIKNLQEPICTGFAQFSIEPEYSNLHKLAVDSNYRRQGIATLLILNFEKNAKNQLTLQPDGSTMQLNIPVFPDNSTAIRLYEKLGYEMNDSPYQSYASKTFRR